MNPLFMDLTLLFLLGKTWAASICTKIGEKNAYEIFCNNILAMILFLDNTNFNFEIIFNYYFYMPFLKGLL